MQCEHRSPGAKSATARVLQSLACPAAVIAVCLAANPAQSQHAHATGSDTATARHRFDNAAQWAQRFEDPVRDAWQWPDSVVATLVERDDLIMADIGSATGYFPVRFARRLHRGLVYGADIEPAMIFYLNDRARSEGLKNLISVLAAADDPHLPQAVDLVFLCDTYHHIDARIAYFERLKAQLRPGGRVAIVDFRIDSKQGPPHKLAKEAVLNEMAAAGYRLVREHDFLPEQYFLIYDLGE
ncbi:MAG TPA: class I SAM-dependent methyltransferase [Candidatus Krumholzibacteria bacterium]|nr:class I SAM-dependent methyltransferase [Candidatus Krumholzibacteria bacterium]